MAENMTKPIFFEADDTMYCVTPAGRTWLVHYNAYTGFEDPIEVSGLPNADFIDTIDMDPKEAIEHCRRIEAVSGETLIGTAD